MTTFFIIGAAIAVGVLLLSLSWVWFAHKSNRNEITMWRLVIDAFNMPTKALTQGSQYFALVITFAVSTAVATTLHERMEDAGDAWKDISLLINLAIQYLGTIAVYLIPMLAGLILDDRNRREGFTPTAAAAYQFRNTGIGIAVTTALIVIGLIVGNIFDAVSTAMMTSASFFTVSMLGALAFIIYGYNKRGASPVEVMTFALAVIFGAGVYAVDFHWNQQLTIEVPLGALDLDTMTDAQITQAVNDANQAFTNRTLITLLLILLDLFAASLALLSGEIMWLVRLQQAIANTRIREDINTNAKVSGVKGVVNNNNTNTTPPVTNPTSGGGGPDPMAGRSI